MLREGGIGVVIGPVEPANPILRRLAEHLDAVPGRGRTTARGSSAPASRTSQVHALAPDWYRGRSAYAVAVSRHQARAARRRRGAARLAPRRTAPRRSRSRAARASPPASCSARPPALVFVPIGAALALRARLARALMAAAGAVAAPARAAERAVALLAPAHGHRHRRQRRRAVRDRRSTRSASVDAGRAAFHLFWTLVAGLSVNVFIVGINQITDVEIDRVNKPYLPIAAGDLSLERAWLDRRAPPACCPSCSRSPRARSSWRRCSPRWRSATAYSRPARCA